MSRESGSTTSKPSVGRGPRGRAEARLTRVAGGYTFQPAPVPAARRFRAVAYNVLIAFLLLSLLTDGDVNPLVYVALPFLLFGWGFQLWGVVNRRRHPELARPRPGEPVSVPDELVERIQARQRSDERVGAIRLIREEKRLSLTDAVDLHTLLMELSAAD